MARIAENLFGIFKVRLSTILPNNEQHFKGAEHVELGEVADDLPRGREAGQLHVQEDRDRPRGDGVRGPRGHPYRLAGRVHR